MSIAQMGFEVVQPPRYEPDDEDILFKFNFHYSRKRWLRAEPLLREYSRMTGVKHLDPPKEKYEHGFTMVIVQQFEKQGFELFMNLAECCSAITSEHAPSIDFLRIINLKYEEPYKSWWQQLKDIWRHLRNR